ncbi:MAG: GTP 3',8-cyclase MoaA [Myxococcota bacterium]
MPPTSDSRGRLLRDLRISVTDRCNFRCPYCMPAEIYGEHYEFLARPDLLTFEEIERLVRLFIELGVEKIRITGGEPLLRHQLPSLIERLAALDGLRDLTLTTNGYLLARQAKELAEAGLQRITVSLDSDEDAAFKTMNGLGFGTEKVLEGIAAAHEAGLRPIKINCVVERGINEDAIVGLARMWKGTGHIVRYIEFMDVGTLNQWKLSNVVTAEEIVERIDAVFPLEPLAPSYHGEVASRYRYKDGSGEIGVISSVSQPFCGSCTRARLTIDGSLVTCLFATGGMDLRTPMRAGAGDDELRDLIRGVWLVRSDRYSEERAGITDSEGNVKPRPKIEMYHIGG